MPEFIWLLYTILCIYFDLVVRRKLFLKLLFGIGVFVIAALLLLLFPASRFLRETRNDFGLVLLKWLFYAVFIIGGTVALITFMDSSKDGNGDSYEDRERERKEYQEYIRDERENAKYDGYVD